MAGISLNKNILSLNVQRHLGQHLSNLEKSFEQLSSGMRINKASDDAAGLSISTILTTDARVANQGIRNFNDGISYLSIAEGALGELSNIVQRIQELAQQSANGIYSDTQRVALQKEVDGLQSEYNRIIDATEFNGKQLLTGSDTNIHLQGGYGTDGVLATQVGDSANGDSDSAGETTRYSTTSSNAQSAGDVYSVDISIDGRYLAFSSDGNDLVSGDANGQRDIFRKDTETGEVLRVNTTSGGVEANGHTENAMISADGRYVLFESEATNLVSGDSNGARDIFRKDVITGEILRVTTASNGGQSNGFSADGQISADGRYVSFSSDATNLVAGDTNGVRDIFRKDLETGEVIRVSEDAQGAQGGGASNSSDITASGRYVVFQSESSNLVTGDTNATGDVFRKDIVTGEVVRVNTDANGSESAVFAAEASISADGRYVSFDSSATDLNTGGTNGQKNIFRKDLTTGEVLLVSQEVEGVFSDDQSYTSSISADGRYVAFLTDATNLLSSVTLSGSAALRKDLNTGDLELVNTSTAGAVDNADALQNIALTADGRKLAFISDGSNLVQGDTNGGNDAFVRDASKAGVQQIAGMVISNSTSAQYAIDLAEKYSEELTNYKVGIGVSISRANSFLDTLRSTSENYTAASSRITDLDVASEVANLTQTQILLNVSNAILSQANQSSDLVFELL